MTKADMLDLIEFALSELADVQDYLHRIQEAPIEDPRPGQLCVEAAAFTVGRCQQMAVHADTMLALAVGNLRNCLIDPQKPIPSLTTALRERGVIHLDAAGLPRLTKEAD